MRDSNSILIRKGKTIKSILYMLSASLFIFLIYVVKNHNPDDFITIPILRIVAIVFFLLFFLQVSSYIKIKKDGSQALIFDGPIFLTRPKKIKLDSIKVIRYKKYSNSRSSSTGANAMLYSRTHGSILPGQNINRGSSYSMVLGVKGVGDVEFGKYISFKKIERISNFLSEY